MVVVHRTRMGASTLESTLIMSCVGLVSHHMSVRHGANEKGSALEHDPEKWEPVSRLREALGLSVYVA